MLHQHLDPAGRAEATQFASLYYQKGETTWADVAHRVSRLAEGYEDAIYEAILNLELIPSSPILMSAGSQLSMMACHLLDIPDSTEGIFDALRLAAIITKFGGGTGLNFSQLRPRGSELYYTAQGCSTGPVAFMTLFDTMANVMMQGGWRRAALMGILAAEHPDILEFITCKDQDGQMPNFNMSVSVADGPDSIDPEVWKQLVYQAWKNGEPGLLFLDNINASNTLLDVFGPITGTNPCSEMPLLSGESCCLSSINIANISADRLEQVIRLGIRLLDAVIGHNHYPDESICDMTTSLRRVGLGIMGFETMLKANGIPFVSDEALVMADAIAGIMREVAYDESLKMGAELGTCLGSPTRNITQLTIAPTGHTSRIAGVSASIYPDLATQIAMTPRQHVDYLMAWQNQVDNGVSYTINLRHEATVADVDWVYRYAHAQGAKTICVYRDGSRSNQPLKCEGGSCTV